MVELISVLDPEREANRGEEEDKSTDTPDDVVRRLLSYMDSIQTEHTSDDEQLGSVEGLKTEISDRILTHLRMLGYTIGSDGCPKLETQAKDRVRLVQREKKREQLLSQRRLLARNHELLLDSVANGWEIEPSKIEPELVEVKAGTEDGILFRLLTMYWSVPVSGGYGRRMRFLVRDRQNNKVVGLFGITDPVFNLRVRDNWIGWTLEQKKRSLRNAMDVFVLGAIPPYSGLLGGKMICALTTAREVREAYERKYRGRRSIISGRKHDARLLLLTTTSALGRSSLYDRVKLDGRLYFVPVGLTQGYGHFHIPANVFSAMRQLLIELNHPYAKGNRFGNGPNWRMRVIRVALQSCGLSPEILRHQVGRESYMIPLAENTKECLLDPGLQPDYYDDDVETIAGSAIRRWVIPRAARRPEFRHRRNWQILEDILTGMGVGK